MTLTTIDRDHDVQQGDDRHRSPFGDLGGALGQDPVERRGEDHPGRRQEQRPRPAQEPHAEQHDHPDLEDRVVDEVRHEQRRIAPDRAPSGRSSCSRRSCDEVRVRRGEELPAECLRGEEHERERQAGGDPDAAEHAAQDLAEVTRAADLAVQRRAPVRVEDPEEHERDHAPVSPARVPQVRRPDRSERASSPRRR